MAYYSGVNEFQMILICAQRVANVAISRLHGNNQKYDCNAFEK